MSAPPGEQAPPKAASAAVTESGRERVLKGTAWTAGSYVAGNLLRLVSNLVLAHLLFPEAFALLALAGILTQGLKMFSDIGIGPSIIQNPRGEEQAFLNTAWTMQVIRGAGLFVVACGLTYPFAQFYQAPLLLWIIPVLALQSVISGFNSTSLFIMSRRITLGRVSALGLGESVVKLAVTVGWAVVHPSVWAFIGGIIAAQVFYTVASHVLLPSHRHRLTWNKDAAQELIQFGRWVFLSTVITFFAQQADRLLLGKLIPLELLGVYSIALMFSRLPIEICGAVSGSVLFPALASVFRADQRRVAEVLWKARRVLLTISAAGTIGFMVVSPWFFQYAYDQRYHDAMWMAPLLALATWFAILQSSCDRALLAFGDTRALFVSNLVNVVAAVGACLVCFRIWGMPGFIIGFALGNLAGHLVIVAALVQRRALRVSQDLGYTAVVFAAGALGVWLPWHWSTDLATHEGVVRLVIQAALAAAAGIVAVRTALDVIRKR